LKEVVSATGFFDTSGALRSMGLPRGFCHSAIGDPLTAGIGPSIAR
jgi:hypothetical protein